VFLEYTLSALTVETACSSKMLLCIPNLQCHGPEHYNLNKMSSVLFQLHIPTI
jgi:hypothetical protein